MNAALIVLTLAPALISEGGQSFRAWLKERRKTKKAEQAEEIRQLKARISALESSARWR